MTKTILVPDWDSDNKELKYLERERLSLVENGNYRLLDRYPLEFDQSLGCDVVIIDGHQAEVPRPLAGLPFKQFVKRHVGPMTDALNGVYMDLHNRIHAVVEPNFRGRAQAQSFTAFTFSGDDLPLFSCWFLALMAGQNSDFYTSPIKLADPPVFPENVFKAGDKLAFLLGGWDELRPEVKRSVVERAAGLLPKRPDTAQHDADFEAAGRIVKEMRNRAIELDDEDLLVLTGLLGRSLDSLIK